MTRLIADATSIGNVFLSDEQTAATAALLDLMNDADLVEPAHWPVEACGLLLKAARRQRMSIADRDAALQGALGLIALAEVDRALRMEAAVELAVAQHISIYDAAYLELALRTGLPLLTEDRALRGAAERTEATLIRLS